MTVSKGSIEHSEEHRHPTSLKSKMSRCIALKFAYEGAHFSGFQRQPERRTVEGDIRSALFRLEKVLAKDGTVVDNGKPRTPPSPLVPDNQSPTSNPFSYSYASRTDSGVSALGNVLVLEYRVLLLNGPELIHYLNDSLENITFHSFTEVDEGFNPRHATERWYRYILPTVELPPRSRTPYENRTSNGSRTSYGNRTSNGSHTPYGNRTSNGIPSPFGIRAFGKVVGFDAKLAEQAAAEFVGSHDFTSFAKVELGKDPVRTISSIRIRLESRVTGLPPMVIIDVKGESFLWMMVRFIIGGMLKVVSGSWSVEDISHALDHPDPRRKPTPVSPNQLILMDVKYPGVTFSKMRDDGARLLDDLGTIAQSIEMVRWFSTQ